MHRHPRKKACPTGSRTSSSPSTTPSPPRAWTRTTRRLAGVLIERSGGEAAAQSTRSPPNALQTIGRTTKERPRLRVLPPASCEAPREPARNFTRARHIKPLRPPLRPLATREPRPSSVVRDVIASPRRPGSKPGVISTTHSWKLRQKYVSPSRRCLRRHRASPSRAWEICPSPNGIAPPSFVNGRKVTPSEKRNDSVAFGKGKKMSTLSVLTNVADDLNGPRLDAVHFLHPEAVSLILLSHNPILRIRRV